MAKKRTSTRTAARSAGAARATTSRRSERTAESTVEAGGIGIEGGVGIATTLTLLVAFLLLDYTFDKFLGSGMFPW